MSEFAVKSVEELCADGVLFPPMDGNHGGIHPKATDYVPTGIPFIMASDLANGHVDTKRCAFITLDQANQLKKGFSVEGDVLLTHKATIGRSAIVGKIDSPFIMLTPQVTYYRVKNPSILSNQYLYYYFNSKVFLDLFNQWSGAGSTRAYLGITGQRKLPIVLPPIEWQHQISEILASLDNKIELNRRMNETLEAMAQAIFRDWFVDFGPTRRKLNGATDPLTIMGGLVQDAQRAQSLADLFPAALGDDGLPEGWKTVELAESFDSVMGQSPPGTSYNESGSGLPFFQGRRDFGFRFPQRRVYCTAPSRIAEENWTLISVRAPVGDVNRTKERCCIGRGVGAVIHKQKLPSLTYYTVLELKPLLARFDGDGTVFGSINHKQVKTLPVILSSSEIMREFETLVSPMDDLIRTRTDEIEILAATRDLLLPKLMFGKIRLSATSEATA